MSNHVAMETLCCARIPLASLPWLGPLRARGDIRVLSHGEELWLYWSAPDSELARDVLALPGVQLFSRAHGHYFRAGEHLPIFDVPDDAEARTLPTFLSPAPVVPEMPMATPIIPLQLVLVRDPVVRATTLLRVDLSRLVAWASMATTFEIENILVARAGPFALVRGRIPPLPGARFWGESVAVPLGHRLDVEPSTGGTLSEDVLRRVLCLEESELALVSDQGAEIVPLITFGPVTRASLRAIR